MAGLKSHGATNIKASIREVLDTVNTELHFFLHGIVHM